MASACSGLKQDFGSQPETEAGYRQGRHRIPATRPVVSDKALALRLCRKEFTRKWKVVKQVKCLLGKRVWYMWIDTWAGSERVVPSWWFESLKKNDLFSFWLRSVFVATRRVCPVAAMVLLCSSSAQASRCGGFSSCRAWAIGVQA